MSISNTSANYGGRMLEEQLVIPRNGYNPITSKGGKRSRKNRRYKKRSLIRKNKSRTRRVR